MENKNLEEADVNEKRSQNGKSAMPMENLPGL